MDKHDIISDIKRVASELGEVPKRDEYLDLGKFSKNQVVQVFGSWTLALFAAGLVRQRVQKILPEERKLKKELEVHDDRQDIIKKYENELVPFIGKYDRGKKEVFTGIVSSDHHSQWLDPWVWSVKLDVAKRMQPDYFILAGDVLDFYQVSFHDTNPRRQFTLQSEINFLTDKILKEAREACPNAEIDFLLGNHEIRLFRYLCSKAPALSSLDCLQFHNLFKLKDYEINLIARRSFLNPKRNFQKKSDYENYKIYNEIFAVTHGTATGRHPAMTELNRWGMSGASGHVHRRTTFFHHDLNGVREWNTLGCMCQPKSGEEYIPDFVNWNEGFLIFHGFRGKVFTEYVDCSRDFVCVGGKYYFRDAEFQKSASCRNQYPKGGLGP